ncbi:ABC-type transport system involved in multi-copper enzyme maturation, permease component [Arenibacter palladensis]|uniref:ABC-type transport system involved in multi-copper enzyme maturation, permease component n=1 Tax=Arenibacter palladensis TaxID=237373 RepID=A0A1M5AVD8_9FLAO|nr:ABC transporter permease subunit [Arenibacter palladensis]SHF33902.1 ABC-type transport system involved in multi-copper enzyme maturation, permease component [Arenibacter palladensis]
MLRLLQIEFIKLWNNNASKVLIVSYFVLILCMALIAAIKFDIGPIQFHVAEQGIFNFPYIWHLNTWIASGLKLFFAIVIVSMMANEYSNKTLKQNLIDGLSKKEFIASKFLTVFAFSVVSTLFVFIVSLVLGLFYSDFTEVSIIFSDLEYLLAYFIKLLGFFSFCLFLGILVKRSAFALGFLIIWFAIENLGIRFLVWWLAGKEASASVMKFLPLESMSNLIKEPASRFKAVQSMVEQVGEQFNKDYAVHFYEILIVACWTAIFIYLSYALLKRRDL